MKIAIMGFSGGGKSTLAKKLGERTGAPVLHLDAVHHLPGWREREREDERAIVDAFLRSHESWVIDGNYFKVCMEERLESADLVILLQLNRVSCLMRAVRRYLTWRGRTRSDMAPGCPEKLDRKFILWILRDGRTKQRKDKYREIAARYPQKIVTIKTQRQIDALTRKMEREGFFSVKS